MHLRRPVSSSILTLGTRAVLALAVLVGTADLASRAAFTERTLQARVDGTLRRNPLPVSFDETVSAEPAMPIMSRHRS